jgi:hypothetical protein
MSSVTAVVSLFDALGRRDCDEDFDGWQCSPAFLIISAPTDAVVDAWHAASPRFMVLSEHGVELQEDEACSGRYWTPSYVSGAEVTECGVYGSVDTQGDLSRAMADAIVRILIEELAARGATARIGPPTAGFAAGAHQAESHLFPRCANIQGEPPGSWVVARVTDGAPGSGSASQALVEHLTFRDGKNWTTDRDAAAVYGSTPDEWYLNLLRQESPGARVDAVYVQLGPEWAVPVKLQSRRSR